MKNIILGVAFVAAVVWGLDSVYDFGGSNKPVAIPDAAPGASPTAPRPIKENVVAFHTGDAAIDGARKTARATLPRFRELVAAGTSGTYTVKFPLTQNGATEHIWMQLVDRDGDTYVGLLANDPVNGNAYKMGDRMTVAEADIEDWMVRGDGVIYGGYTARVALDQMPKAEADKYRPMFRD